MFEWRAREQERKWARERKSCCRAPLLSMLLCNFEAPSVMCILFFSSTASPARNKEKKKKEFRVRVQVFVIISFFFFFFYCFVFFSFYLFISHLNNFRGGSNYTQSENLYGITNWVWSFDPLENLFPLYCLQSTWKFWFRDCSTVNFASTTLGYYTVRIIYI